MTKKLSALKKKLWTLTSEYVRRSGADYRGYASCVTCGLIKHWREQQAGHFIARAQGNAVYFDLRNIAVQCYRCNINLGGNGPEYFLWMEKKYGREVIDELRRLSNTVVKFRTADYDRMIEEMKVRITELDKRKAQ